jgi:cytochrome c-type biogenesis protein CcmH
MEASEPVAQSIFTTVMSPYCPGKLLSDCPSAKASELKHLIRDELAQGKSKEEVLLKLQDEYGAETLRAVPEASGFGLLAWLAPILFLVGGLVLGFRVVANLAKKQ